MSPRRGVSGHARAFAARRDRSIFTAFAAQTVDAVGVGAAGDDGVGRAKLADRAELTLTSSGFVEAGKAGQPRLGWLSRCRRWSQLVHWV